MDLNYNKPSNQKGFSSVPFSEKAGRTLKIENKKTRILKRKRVLTEDFQKFLL